MSFELLVLVLMGFLASFLRVFRVFSIKYIIELVIFLIYMVQMSKYKVSKMTKETPDTVSFVLFGEAMDFVCGQFVMVHYPAELAEKKNEDGKPVKRAYSIASSVARGKKGEIELCVKQMPGGWISKLLQNINLGQEFDVQGPFGKFLFKPEEDKDIVMLAAGSGIAPFNSFIEEIVLAGHKDVKAQLIFSNKTESDIIYKETFDKYAAQNENISVNYTLTRCSDDSWKGLCGRVDAKMLKEQCGAVESKLFFICGPLTFVKAMRSCLEELGVLKENVRFESYG